LDFFSNRLACETYRYGISPARSVKQTSTSTGSAEKCRRKCSTVNMTSISNSIKFLGGIYFAPPRRTRYFISPLKSMGCAKTFGKWRNLVATLVSCLFYKCLWICQGYIGGAKSIPRFFKIRVYSGHNSKPAASKQSSRSL